MARLISSATLYHLHVTQGRRDELCDWIRANGLNPNDVSSEDDITIEDTSNGQLIRCRTFATSSGGNKICGPMEDRAVPLVVEPPDGWPVYAVPARSDDGPAARVILDNSDARIIPSQPLKPHYPDERRT